MAEDPIAKEVRAFFDEMKALEKDKHIQPGEFTRRMFVENSGLSEGVSKARLKAMVENGEVTVREGVEATGRACMIYKPVKKKV